MSVDTLRHKSRAVGRGEGVEWLGRAGLVAQGVVYALIALLAAQVAIDGRDAAASPDKEGALKLVVDQPGGRLLLGLLALGLFGYAAWRLAQAVVDRNNKGDGAKGLAKRAGYAAIGLWYGFLGVLAVQVLLSGGDSSSSGGSEQQTTAGVFDWPLGRELVFAVGAGFLVASGWNVYRAFGGNLDKHLRTHEMSDGAKKAALTAGAIGHSARAVVWALIGIFLVKAAWEFDAQEARGLDGALLEVVQQPFGPLLLGIVALGLFAFAVWCWVQARYRRV